MIELLKNLIEIESISGNEQKLLAFLESELEKLFPKKVSNLDQNLLVTLDSNNPGPTILFCSHIDTVPVTSGWTKDPFKATLEGQIDGTKIFGLGANDALASVVSMIYAADAQKNKIAKGKVLLCFVREEERGMDGFCAIEKLLPRYDFGIFGEPTELNIGYCMRGSIHARVRVHGQSCHASRPWEGKNAIYELGRVLNALENLPLKDNSPWGRATVEPTIVKGGTAENQLPDLIELTLDIRPTFEINNEKILKMLSDLELDFTVKTDRRKAMMCDKESPLVKAIQKVRPKSELYAFGGSCDMAFSTAPSIVMGPGQSKRSHSADEYIMVEELEDAVKTFANVIAAMNS